MSGDIEQAVAKAIFRADDMVGKTDFAWGETTAASYRAMATASLAALGEAGYAVVELPKRWAIDRVSEEWGVDRLQVTLWTNTTEPRRISCHDAGSLFTADQARTLAAALLAAADAAEQVTA